uniref:Pre-mRNA cleavage complex 2 protein Pcf11 n=1 Tax=Nyssomyia neivai TaxID=330878 RepID=A0A1L8DCG8_9DIPT
MAEIGEEYLSSLADLNVNSKPLINMLTIIAEENMEHAEVIVKAVEQHLAKVNPDVKLPVLYLIDSIVKNVGGQYKALFGQYIVNMFCGVFEKVNEKMREKMFALRQTWNEVFTQQKLYTLDVKINCMDPGWPITAKVKGPAIHLNPNFLKNKTAGDPKLTEMAKLSEMQAQLRDKQRELLELQKHKLELELVATKQRIEEEEKKINIQTASVKMVNQPPIMIPPGMPPHPMRGFMPRPGSFPPRMSHPGPPVSAPMGFGPPMGNKMRVAPVNPALVSSVQLRDPRLVRQMQQQMARQAEVDSSMPPQRRFPADVPGTSRGPKMDPKGMPGKHMGARKVVTNKENKTNRTYSSSSSKVTPTKTSKTTSPRSSSSDGKVKEKSSSRDRRDSSSSSSSGKTKHKRSYSGDRTKGEKNHVEKSPKKPKDVVEVVEDTSSVSEHPMFRDMKLAPGTRSFLKQSTSQKGISPTPPAPPTISTAETCTTATVCDVDLRIAPIVDVDTQATTEKKGTEVKVSCENDEKKKANDASLPDVDLRQFPSDVAQPDVPQAIENVPKVAESMAKKRANEEQEDENNVASKKSKSDKLDVLFGSQDMDLRTLGAIKAAASTAEALTPPPPPIISHENDTNWTKLKADTPKKQKELKANLAAIRAKLAEATKPKKPPVQITEILETKRKLHSKFTNVSPSGSPKASSAKMDIVIEDTSSQDASDANIKIIVAQAQEQLDTKAIDQEQYNNMMKQMMQLSETHKMMEAQKREAGDDAAARRKLQTQIAMQKSPDTTTPTIESSFATTTAADIRRSERPAVWDTQQTPWMVNQMPPAINPWSNPMGPFGNFVGQQQPNVAEVLQQHVVAQAKPKGNMLTIKIDNVPREIRFYDDIAIAFMNWDHPKEIGFQNGQRRITCDDKYSIVLSFNAANIAWNIDGVTHQIRLGCPTRELYIDNQWYECFFNEPIRVELNGVVRTFKIEGPAPQVRIGSLRTDLVVGKINVIIDAIHFIPIFLDGKEQQFELNGQMHTLQFADFLLTVIINGVPSAVVFGGLPKSYELKGNKHFIRFTALPAGVVPGQFFIRNMLRTVLHEDLVPPTPPSSATSAAAALAAVAAENPTLTQTATTSREAETTPSSKEDEVVVDVPPTKKVVDEEDVEKSTEAPTVSIDALFQKLLASGILSGGSQVAATEKVQRKKSRHEHEHKSTSSKEKAVKPINLTRPETIKTRQSAIVHQLFSGMQCSSCGVRFPPEQTMKYSQHLDWHFRQNRRDRDSARKAHSRKWYYDVTDWIQYEEIEDLEEREKNWFETQQQELSATQEDSNQRGGTDSPIPSCLALPDDSNRICDVCHDPFEQFYNEETEEWHLRPAIRVEERTYHPLCYADYQASLTLNESKVSDVGQDDDVANSATSPTDDDDDVKMIEDDDEAVVVVKQEKVDEEIFSLGLVPNGDGGMIVPGLEGDDDDVIEVAPIEPTITEILDDDEEEKKDTTGGASSPEKSPTKSAQLEESDVEIQEPHIPIQDLDEIEDEPAATDATAEATTAPVEEVAAVKIKEEPKDDGYEDDVFMDVGTSFDPGEEMIIDEETLDEDPKHGKESHNGQEGDKMVSDGDGATETLDVGGDNSIGATKASEAPQMIATIDGNVEMQEAAPAGASMTNKIRINISNSIVVGNKAQSSINTIVSDVREPEQLPENLKAVNVKSKVAESVMRVYPKFANGYETSGLCSIM